MNIWQKEHTNLSEAVKAFTVGRDREFDIMLAKYDVQGSIAHITMLEAVGLLPSPEFLLLKAELEKILNDIAAGSFTMMDEAEDIHSQIEFMLTAKLGDAGKKIHSGRSRNDQIAVDIKLCLRNEIQELKQSVMALFTQLQQLSEQHKEKLLPGYTHFQLAMPSSFGLWFGAYAESLIDDMNLLVAAWKITDKNPLGSGAGYGSSFPLNRKMTTQLLNFSEMHYNSVYAQMSRGKTERFLAMALSSIAATLSRFSTDVCIYINQQFGFISFPDALTTGSSIMPHKKNPDVFELVRARCNRIQAIPNELTLLINNLPSGYHRDLQLTKEILFPAIEELKGCLQIVMLMLQNITVKENLFNDPQYKYLFTVERINNLVTAEIPFRDAYLQVSKEVESGTFNYTAGLHHTHEGSIGNLCTSEIKKMMNNALKGFATD